MSLTQSKKDATQVDKSQSAADLSRLRTWLLAWEIYPILLVIGFLCLYRINTTEFNTDQADIFSMARDAIRYGLIPITSNAASLGITNPPAVVYILMLPAVLSANPLWAAVQQGLLTTSAALLAYIFTRRYYGRLASIVATLLYATAATTIHFGRFIWQQNMMSPFVILFMFALFWGVVERRKGWFAPAIFLLGLLFQLHQSTALLVIPLLVAVVLAPKTIRWRDLLLAFVLLFILYFPYLLWENFSRLSDLHAFSTLSIHENAGSNQAISFYRLYLSPYGQQPTIASSVILKFVHELSWLHYAIPLLLLCGGATALLLLFQPPQPQSKTTSPDNEETTPPAKNVLRAWWSDFRATPSKSGLVLLLVWQVVPMLILTQVTIILQLHYLIFLMPGPYILIGLFIAKVVELFRQYQPQWSVRRYAVYAVYALVALVVAAQLVGSLAAVIDITSGNFDDRAFYIHYRNDLNSLQQALNEADRVAQQRHLNRVYVTTDDSTATALHYLSEQMQTPTTLFDATNCLVLPNPADGPAVLLVGPYDGLTNALVNQFASATLVDQPVRPGGAPFRLYIVTPSTVQAPPAANTFGNDLQLLNAQTQSLQSNNASSTLWMVTRWNLLRTTRPALRTAYNYAVTAQPNGGSALKALCNLSTIRAGDQLLAAFPLSKNSLAPSSVTVGVQSYTTVPYNPAFGLLHFETYIDNSTPPAALQTPGGGSTITLPSS
jgi:4-amino-4-deoxy-L-arabinose transferase-like glycosyltransferase